MTFKMGILISCTSVLWFLAALLGSYQLLELWDRMIKSRLREPVDRFLQLRMSEYWMTEGLRACSILLIAAVMILFVYCRAYPLAISLGYVGSVLPGHVLSFLNRRREWLLEKQLVGTATGVENGLKAGLSIPQALKTVAEEAPYPLNVELKQISYQFEHGRPLPEVLADTRRRLDLESFTLFCLALEVACERAGQVNVAMNRLSSSLQEWFRLRGKLQADTASDRFAVLIMSLAPFALMGLFYLASLPVLYFFQAFWGQMAFSLIVLLICFSNRVASRILNIKIA